MPSYMYRPQKCSYPFCKNRMLQKPSWALQHVPNKALHFPQLFSCSRTWQKSPQSHMNEVCSLLLILLIWCRSRIYPPVFYRELMPTNSIKTGSLWKRTKPVDVTKGKEQLETPSSVKRTPGITSLLPCFPLIQENTI